MLGVCLRPEDFDSKWEFVELQFEKSARYDLEWKWAGPRFGVHAPYYVTLTHTKRQKTDDAIMRIAEAADVALKLNADLVVARAGFYSKQTPEEAMEVLVTNCVEILGAIRVPLGIETQPKPTQFGSVKEVLALADRVGTVPVINISATQDREGMDWQLLQSIDKPYIHFSEASQELAGALPEKYTLVAESVAAAEEMQRLI